MLGTGAYALAIEQTLKKANGDGLICEKTVVGKPNPMIIEIIRE